MNSTAENNFVETLEYRRFKEFCDACSRYCYIGLCYGSPGVGKTLSAQHFSRRNQIQGVKLRDIPDDRLQELAQLDVVLYTTPVVNTPREIERDIPKLRELLRHFRHEPIRRGLVLIGMPGIEKRLARYPQFYSRIGFVHEFRTLSADQMRELLAGRWRPWGVALPEAAELDAETVASIIRVSGGNFRLLGRLLTQVERILEINRLNRVTAAR